ncbi:MAG: lipoprotein-releasing ABC transporter permease subunit [bacterium]|nr:lipoprotein-releasing ABC transporter permease subunit [bacterium]
MIEVLSAGLGLVSASLVALIALAFGLMFVFFSASAALVFGQFLGFAHRPIVALCAGLLAVVLVWVVSLAAGLEPVWALPTIQAFWVTVFYGLVCWRRAHRFVLITFGVLLLIGAGAFAVSLFSADAGEIGFQAAAAIQALLAVVAIGLWPLIVAGMVTHWRERPVEWFLSLRYLVARRRQAFISVISVICVVGVALGVAVITVVLSVMNGFSHMWESKIIGARAHFSVMSRLGEFADYGPIRDEVVKLPGVLGATPYVATEAILRGDSGQIQAVYLKGIDPSTVADVTQLVQDMRLGSLDDMAPVPGAEGLDALHGVIIGGELADRFFLRIGDPLVLISPLGGKPTPLGPAPRLERFRIAGVFRSNFFQFDESYVYSSLAAVQDFMRLENVVSGIEVRTDDAYRSLEVARASEALLGQLFVARDWKTFYPGFFQALKHERVMMFVLLSFIMVVAGFIIIATLMMMIMEKSRDIAILKTMGCPDDGILRVFAIQGFLIGIAGLAVGLGMGLVITFNLDAIQYGVERLIGVDVLPANVYQLQSLPYLIQGEQLAYIALIAMVLSTGATLFPSWQAAKLDPAEALRYE